jgi:transcriptional regulator with XRE-family HTH domain
MIGKRIKECRTEKGLRQSDLAKILCTTQSTIGKYEREELEPSINVIIEMCKTFNVSADYLLGLEDETGAKIYCNNFGSKK